ncbi:MAG: DUF1015 domain-containing protein [Nanoarchaeota archaeon]|nr:DUF1015 domain-containing protein [Nanoarchaeota archaeon]
MVNIKAFKGIRYNSEKVEIDSVITPPYDVISNSQIEEYKNKSKYNYVNIILNKDHKEAADLLKKWQEQEIIKQDNEESLYVYSQIFRKGEKEYTRTGFVALIELEELGRNILPHEKTLAKPLSDRIGLMNKTKFNTGLVLFLYDDKHKIIDKILYESIKDRPEFEFIDNSDVVHKFWKIGDNENIRKISEEMMQYSVIIGDGHHRYKTALEFKRQHPEIENAGYRMACFVNSFNEGMIILPTNRVLFNIDINFDGLLKKINEYFTIEEVQDADRLIEKISSKEIMIDKTKNIKNHVIGFIDNVNKKFYSLNLRNTEIMNKLLPDSTGIYRKLDVNILHKLIFEKILGITEEEQSLGTKIKFVKGSEETLIKLKEEKYKAAFLLNPPLMREIFLTARANETMPQKSTYFYPKIFSGLVLNKLEEEK